MRKKFMTVISSLLTVVIVVVIMIAPVHEAAVMNMTSTTTTTIEQQQAFCYSTEGCKQNFQLLYAKCEGRYCGRRTTVYSHNTYAPADANRCTKCPYGTKSDGWVCVPCNDKISTYSVFFMVFMFGLVPIVNFVSIEIFGVQTLIRLILQISSIAEALIAAILSILCFSPTFNLRTCDIERFSDFYSPMLNPVGKNCTSDRSYPLYTIVMIFYAFSIALLLLIRLPLMRLLAMVAAKQDRKDISEELNRFFYSAYIPMWIIPLITLIHFFLVGVVYHAFTYMGIIGCLVGDIVHSVLIFTGKDKSPIWKKLMWFVLRYMIIVWLIWGILEFFYAPRRVNFLWLILCFISPAMLQVILAVVVKGVTFIYSDSDD